MCPLVYLSVLAITLVSLLFIKYQVHCRNTRSATRTIGIGEESDQDPTDKPPGMSMISLKQVATIDPARSAM